MARQRCQTFGSFIYICLFGFLLFFGQTRSAQAQYLYQQYVTLGEAASPNIGVLWTPTSLSAGSNWTVNLLYNGTVIATQYRGPGQYPHWVEFNTGMSWNTLYTVQIIDTTDNYTYTEQVITTHPTGYGYAAYPTSVSINMGVGNRSGPYTVTLRVHSTGTIVGYITSTPTSSYYNYIFTSLTPNTQYDWAFEPGSSEDTNPADFTYTFFTLPSS